MTYIDHSAPVRATGPTAGPSCSAAKRSVSRRSAAEGTHRLLLAWAMGTWLVR
jgi:hypothetical protein